jgi:DNA/RNA-binding domain of Phe-tRNA-synthetase-like protein
VQRLTYTIADAVFARFPGYVRGVVLAHGVTNGPSPADLLALLRAAEEEVRRTVDAAAGGAAAGGTAIADHPRIHSWREAFRALGAKPTEHRPSIEAPARRVARGDPLPAINALVEIGNIVSLRHLLPARAHAVDQLVEDMWLRPAAGGEAFVALDGDAVEHPAPGEFILAQGEQVLTRRWVWRQGIATLIRPDTTAAEINVDGLPPVPAAEVEEACRETAALVERFCGGRTRWAVLSAEHRSMSLDEEG